jgi:predicted nucleic acid-binding protein
MTERGVLDTSVFIASESGRALDVSKLPDESAISVITLAELNVGVLAARDTVTRAVRLSTLNSVSDIELLPIDGRTARCWATLRVQLAEAGRRINVNDLWIAATAISRGLPVVTQADDFTAVEGLAGLVVVHV